MSKSKRKRKKGLLAQSYQNSLIISTLNTASAKLQNKISDSAASRFFCSADKFDAMKNSSMLHRAVTNIGITQLFSKIKTSFARLVESSSIVSVYRRIVNAVLCSCARDAGIFLLCFGLFSLAATLLKVFMLSSLGAEPENSIICIAAVLICALPLLFSKKSIAEKLVNSSVFSFLFSGILGVSPLTLRSKLTPKSHNAAALSLGTAIGTLSFIFQPTDIVLTFALLILACIVLYSPESGMLSALVMMPFASYNHLKIVLFASLISYFLKLLRGKRNLTLTATDIFAIIFSVTLILFFGIQSITSIVTLCFVYILIVNLFRNFDLLEKGINALSFGLFISSLATSALRISDLAEIDITGHVPFITLLTGHESALLSLICVPIALLMLHNSKKAVKSSVALLFFASATVNAATSFSVPIWLGYLSVLIVYSIMRSAKPFTTLLGTALTLPFIYLLISKLSLGRELISLKTLNPFKYSELPVRVFGGGIAEKSDSVIMSLTSVGGILLLAVFLLTSVLLLTVGLTAINRSRLGSVRLICGSLITTLISCVYLFFIPSTFGDGRTIVITFCAAALLSCSGNVFSRLYGTEDC